VFSFLGAHHYAHNLRWLKLKIVSMLRCFGKLYELGFIREENQRLMVQLVLNVALREMRMEANFDTSR
tara:strand:+ start:11631 stop:11834 length:204 start_codon:yes stop_codon:yes gene_type:complete